MTDKSLWGISNYLDEINSNTIAMQRINDDPPKIFRDKAHWQLAILDRVWNNGFKEGKREEKIRIAGLLRLL